MRTSGVRAGSNSSASGDSTCARAKGPALDAQPPQLVRSVSLRISSRVMALILTGGWLAFAPAGNPLDPKTQRVAGRHQLAAQPDRGPHTRTNDRGVSSGIVLVVEHTHCRREVAGASDPPLGVRG